jgi:hypothetical protein
MPKLSQQTLEKRFKCPHCGESIRSRQGLSGHIQFKHKPGIPAKKESYEERYLRLGEKIVKFKGHASVAGFNEEEASEIFLYWERIKTLFELEQITVNNSDFKNYLIVSLAQMRANQRLYKALVADLADGMAAGFTRLSNEIAVMKAKS